MIRLCCALLALAAASTAPRQARAQTLEDEFRISAFEATPIGALPPIALPMPASRNHNYWGVRVQAGQRRGRGGPDLFAVAGGVDLQWRGGSIFGFTTGYQTPDCDGVASDCGGHALFGARARLNVITGGPTIGALFGDHTATSTLGTELGLGYAPDVSSGVNACTVDVGVPLSLAMLQRVRLVTYVTPAVALDIDCSAEDRRIRASFLTSLGIGVQQLGARGLDVYLGFQKIFRSATGYHFGISATYVRLP